MCVECSRFLRIRRFYKLKNSNFFDKLELNDITDYYEVNL